MGHSIKKYLYSKLSESSLALIINVMPNYKLSIKAQNDHFLVRDKQFNFYISRAHRLFKYKSGLRNRLEEITNKYFLKMIDF